MIPGANWYAVKDGEPAASALYERHYSCVNLAKRRRTGDKRICGPGQHMVLMTQDFKALFVWVKHNEPDLAGQAGVYCAIFRNESDRLSSDLIREAERLAWRRWPGERLYTYINPRAVKSRNPGYCFKVTGWRKCGITKVNKLIILEKTP
jgi:hypothetical protein